MENFECSIHRKEYPQWDKNLKKTNYIEDAKNIDIAWQ